MNDTWITLSPCRKKNILKNVKMIYIVIMLLMFASCSKCEQIAPVRIVRTPKVTYIFKKDLVKKDVPVVVSIPKVVKKPSLPMKTSTKRFILSGIGFIFIFIGYRYFDYCRYNK